jgi:hypothetical protein
MLKLFYTLVLLANLFVIQTAYGKDKLPKSLSETLLHSPLIEVGNAKFSVLFWDIYHSKLYTPTGNYNVENNTDNLPIERPLLFKINYLKNISQQELINRTIEQWQHLGFKEAEFSPFIAQLKIIWPNIEAGDSLALLINKDSSSFYFNDQFIGTVSQKSFGQLFLAIWLSPYTSEPKLRQKLLGKLNSKL